MAAQLTTEVPTAALRWVISRNTCLSSMTLWAVMMGLRYEFPRTPRDSCDFARCHDLLEAVPEWKPCLKKMAEIYPAWVPIVELWEILTNLHLRGHTLALDKVLEKR